LQSQKQLLSKKSLSIIPFLRFLAYRQANFKKYRAGGDEEGDEDKTDSSESSNMNWEVLSAKLVTAYKAINKENVLIGHLGFAILVSDKKSLKMILYKSKIDLLSSIVLKESDKIYVKGKFIQYMDASNNFWSVLFDNENDRDEIIRLLEERCTIERDEMESSIKANGSSASNQNNEMESENQDENNAKNDEDATCADKSVETDPEEKQSKQMKANILSRMAKMGKRLVPSGSNKASASEESASENNSPENSPKRQPIVRKPNNSSTATSSPILQIAKLQPSPHIPHTIEFRHNNNNSNNSNIISAASSDSSLNLMMMQNTEIRFNLSKLDSKLDKLCDRIEVLSTASNLSGANARSGASEQTSIDEMHELKVQLKALTHENKEYKKHIVELSEKNERIHALESQTNRLKHALEEAEVEMRTKEADLGELKSQLNCSKRFAEELEISMAAIRESQRNRFSKETQTTAENSKTSEHHLQENHIKEMMNSLYFKLCERISNLHELKHSEILKIIGQVIKQETQEILRKNIST
jgi:hypothetical protein